MRVIVQEDDEVSLRVGSNCGDRSTDVTMDEVEKGACSFGFGGSERLMRVLCEDAGFAM
jgi:hypothetical protein